MHIFFFFFRLYFFKFFFLPRNFNSCLVNFTDVFFFFLSCLLLLFLHSFFVAFFQAHFLFFFCLGLSFFNFCCHKMLMAVWQISRIFFSFSRFSLFLKFSHEGLNLVLLKQHKNYCWNTPCAYDRTTMHIFSFFSAILFSIFYIRNFNSCLANFTDVFFSFSRFSLFKISHASHIQSSFLLTLLTLSPDHSFNFYFSVYLFSK